MATIVDIKPSFMDMSYGEQFDLIQKVQESRLIPKKIVKARAKKALKKQMTIQEMLAEVKVMHPQDRQRFMEENGLI